MLECDPKLGGILRQAVEDGAEPPPRLRRQTVAAACLQEQLAKSVEQGVAAALSARQLLALAAANLPPDMVAVKTANQIVAPLPEIEHMQEKRPPDAECGVTL